MKGVERARRKVKRNTRGRQPLPVDKRRSKSLSIDVTPEEYERLENLALTEDGTKTATMGYRCFIDGLQRKEVELSNN